MIENYESAVEELCVLNFIDNWDHSKPLETLSNIIQHEINMALDPKISSRAIELIERYGGKYNN